MLLGGNALVRITSEIDFTQEVFKLFCRLENHVNCMK